MTYPQRGQPSDPAKQDGQSRIPSAGVTQLQWSYDPVRLPPKPSPVSDVEAATLAHKRVSPDYSDHPSDVPCPLPRRIKRVRVSIASPLMQPSPNGRRVGIRIVTFEACSGFTHVTARRIAQSPKATFSRGSDPCSYPQEPLVSYRINRQLSGWNLPPLMFRALGAHCQQQTSHRTQIQTHGIELSVIASRPLSKIPQHASASA